MDRAVMAKIRLIVSDFLLAFMWVSSGALNKLFVNRVLGWGHEPRGEIMKATLSIINMFFFAFLGKISKGGAYNPLTVLAGAISGDFSRFLFTVGARIPAQGVKKIGSVEYYLNLLVETQVRLEASFLFLLELISGDKGAALVFLVRS
ncbi:putative aquaporin SIP2-1 [Vitis vinifera]|uniref:Putative aquaporin SIP2-1 n=1 Tax=Vitis vinifera TaxID=29760 RepID=A0A438J7L1_VITVI|nr:putative aquaporin SIP2-1 [Vitis vinifera]RVX04953.1 putative aquaporin SIP2-1 [Vitis vinifera]